MRCLEGVILAGVLLAGAAGRCAADQPPEGPVATFPDGHVFHLEIARTGEERARGYMFRERVRSEEGMLFLFPQSDFHPFWMKNCRVALDILWLSEDRRVVHIEREVPPCKRDPCPGYPPMQKARYVLEVKAGMARRSDLKLGDLIGIQGVDWNAPIPP